MGTTPPALNGGDPELANFLFLFEPATLRLPPEFEVTGESDARKADRVKGRRSGALRLFGVAGSRGKTGEGTVRVLTFSLRSFLLCVLTSAEILFEQRLLEEEGEKEEVTSEVTGLWLRSPPVVCCRLLPSEIRKRREDPAWL